MVSNGADESSFEVECDRLRVEVIVYRNDQEVHDVPVGSMRAASCK
jgi:hypothetical protein